MLQYMCFRRYTLDFFFFLSQKYSEYSNKRCWLNYLCIPQIPTIIFTSSGDQKQLGVLNSTSILTEKGENSNTFKLWG